MPNPTGGIGVLDVVAPVVVALLYIALSSLVREPHRREFNAIMVAGAGAAYLSGGLGGWEFGFTALATYVAYRGLRSYPFIGVAWLLHTGWDVVHHLYGNPIVPFVAKSSLGCAICDPVIAVWCFLGAPSLLKARGGRAVQAGWHTVTPRIVAHDAQQLVAFLAEVFGATGEYRPDRPSK